MTESCYFSTARQKNARTMSLGHERFEGATAVSLSQTLQRSAKRYKHHFRATDEIDVRR